MIVIGVRQTSTFGPECNNKLFFAELQKLGTDFVYGYLQVMDGEKDPRNLVLAFQCARRIIENFPLGRILIVHLFVRKLMTNTNEIQCSRFITHLVITDLDYTFNPRLVLVQPRKA